MNYDLMMEEEISKIVDNDSVPTLLLHACCAPCSSSCIERLGNIFKITMFFYNPNITDLDEYMKRLNELKRFVSLFKVKYEIEVVDGGYDPSRFFLISKGLENEKERGPRCYKCYYERISKTMEYADNNNFDFFTTTLSLSPYKNVKWINEIGDMVSDSSMVKFLNCDFKKKNGYKRSIELSRLYNLYRQNYCGCIYSKRDMINKRSD